MTAKRSRRHHFLPQMYLNRFSANPTAKTPQVEVFDMNKGEWRTQALHNTAVRRDYYSVTVPKGRTDLSPDEMEKWLGQIESESAQILTNKIDRQKSLGKDERLILGLFIATLRMRNPFTRERIGEFISKIGEQIAAMIYHRSIKDADYFRQMTEKLQRDTGEDFSDMTPEVLNPTKYDVKADDEYVMGLSFTHVLKIARILATMQWVVYRAPDGARFLSCDNPYFEINPLSRSFYDRAGLFNPNIEVTLPLSSTQFLFISHQKTKGGMYRLATPQQWKTLNYRVFLSMRDFIVTHSRDFTPNEQQLLEWINRVAKAPSSNHR